MDLLCSDSLDIIIEYCDNLSRYILFKTCTMFSFLDKYFTKYTIYNILNYTVTNNVLNWMVKNKDIYLVNWAYCIVIVNNQFDILSEFINNKWYATSITSDIWYHLICSGDIKAFKLFFDNDFPDMDETTFDALMVKDRIDVLDYFYKTLGRTTTFDPMNITYGIFKRLTINTKKYMIKNTYINENGHRCHISKK